MSRKNPISFLGIPEFLVVGFLALFLAASGATAQAQFSGPTDYPVGTAPATAAVGDFNGDDKPGIIRGHAEMSEFLGHCIRKIPRSFGRGAVCGGIQKRAMVMLP
jgi:hypothetical protein